MVAYIGMTEEPWLLPVVVLITAVQCEDRESLPLLEASHGSLLLACIGLQGGARLAQQDT